MEERAHAKINLSLRVLQKRADAFHEIDTTMLPIDLFDSLQLEQGEGLHLACDDPTVPCGEDNLVVRAARLFFGAINREPAVRIKLQKNIPHGAGLGGGSSNAAATLRALNRMFSEAIPHQKLAELAARLGSDVPFFLGEQPARCTGRGEILSAVSIHRRLRLLLVKPQFGISTAWAYTSWDKARHSPAQAGAEQTLKGFVLANDLERPVFQKFVFLARLKSWLLEQSEIEAALLSGSGSTVFGILRSGAVAQPIVGRAATELDPALWTHECETLSG